MGIYNLDKIFNPASIAVVGASERPGKIGTALLANLAEGGFRGRLFPVNPKYKNIRNLCAAASVTDLGASVDLAVIAVPIGRVAGVVRQCAEAEVKAAIIISAGGKETGTAGQEFEREILEAANTGRIRIIGPNCLGVMVPAANLNASFGSGMPNRGNLAFVSQSGGVCTSILDISFKEGIGFSHFVSIGSMLDVDFGDLIDFLGRDPGTRCILLYIEQLSNIRKFISAARAVSRVKPIIALKAGSSPAGARAAASHTGAMAGEDAVYDAAFKRAGVIRVRDIEELFDCAELMAKQPRAGGSRMAVITNGGGPGVMAIDAMARYGLEPAALNDATITALNEILPEHWSRQNPVDILGDATAERYAQSMEILIEHGDVSSLMVILVPQALIDPLAVAEKLVQLAERERFPIFAVWMGGRDLEPSIQFLNNSGIVTYATPERAVLAFTYIQQHLRNVELNKEIPPGREPRLFFNRDAARTIIDNANLSSECFLDENQAKQLLGAYGIKVNPSTITTSARAAVSAAEEIGWPVAMKVLSQGITHKTDADGVHLDLRSPAEVETAYTKIMAGAARYNPGVLVDGVTVQSYLAQPDYELLMGVKRDEMFGPVLLFGMGGIYTEVIHDRALGLPPLNRLLARRLMQETKVFKLLQGYRNKPAADITSLETMLLQLSQLVVDIPEILELDINPVLVRNGIATAVDARISLRSCPRSAPLHLVISPYPSQYELCTTTRAGLRLQIRPIKPDDADLFVELFKSLSPSSVYLRFFQHIKELSPEMTAMLTQTDYDRHMALVAIDLSSTEEKMLGAARIIADPDITQSEFSIMIGDRWQGQGIGEQLLIYLLKVAKKQGINKLWGTVLPENTHMLRLGKKLGFGAKFDRDEGAYYLEIDLTKSVLDEETKI